jgi:hypothetical protein
MRDAFNRRFPDLRLLRRNYRPRRGMVATKFGPVPTGIAAVLMG